MGGTAAGARKARDKMREKLLAETGVKRLDKQRRGDSDAPPSADFINDANTDAVAGNGVCELPILNANQVISDPSAAEILKSTGAASAALLQRVVTGGVRVPAHVRVMAACRVLESQGLLGQQLKRPVEPADNAAILQILERVGRALELRRSAASAEEAHVVGSDFAH
jgi:hypothetical protein